MQLNHNQQTKYRPVLTGSEVTALVEVLENVLSDNKKLQATAVHVITLNKLESLVQKTAMQRKMEEAVRNTGRSPKDNSTSIPYNTVIDMQANSENSPDSPDSPEIADSDNLPVSAEIAIYNKVGLEAAKKLLSIEAIVYIIGHDKRKRTPEEIAFYGENFAAVLALKNPNPKYPTL